MMLVLRDIGQMGEVAVGADNLVRPPPRETVQCRLELLASYLVLVPMEPDRGLANMLDNIENRLSFLLPDGVPEEAAEKTDILTEWKIFIRSCKRRLRHGRYPLRFQPFAALANKAP